jgi:hypothetical protein
MGISAGPNIVRDSSLVLDLDASDQNSYISGSLTWKDVSGKVNNGTLTNGPTYNSTKGGTIVFDGTNDYVTLNTLPNSNFSLISSSFTTEFWANFTTGSNGTLINSAQSAINGGTYSIVVRGNNIYASFYGTPTYTDIGGGTITTGSWYHFVNTFNYTNQTSSVYVNGVLMGAGSMALSPLVTSASLNMGRSNFGSGWFSGSMASAKVYNKTLSATEVQQNYNALKSRFGLR